MLLEALTPFHQQAEEIGLFLAEDRARDEELDNRDVDNRNESPDGPSENTD